MNINGIKYSVNERWCLSVGKGSIEKDQYRRTLSSILDQYRRINIEGPVLLKGVWNGLELAPRRKGDKSTSYPHYKIKPPFSLVGYRKQGSHKTKRRRDLCIIDWGWGEFAHWGHVFQRNGRFGKGGEEGKPQYWEWSGCESSEWWLVKLTPQHMLTWVSWERKCPSGLTGSVCVLEVGPVCYEGSAPLLLSSLRLLKFPWVELWLTAMGELNIYGFSPGGS